MRCMLAHPYISLKCQSGTWREISRFAAGKGPALTLFWAGERHWGQLVGVSPFGFVAEKPCKKIFLQDWEGARGASRPYRASPPFVKTVSSATTLIHLPVEQPCPVSKQWARAALAPAWKELRSCIPDACSCSCGWQGTGLLPESPREQGPARLPYWGRRVLHAIRPLPWGNTVEETNGAKRQEGSGAGPRLRP